MTTLLIKIFIRNYNDISNNEVRERYGKFASIIGLITNIILFCIKIAIGVFSNSVSIMADAINNLSDSGSSVVTLVGFKISGKPADKEHPYGHARMEYIAGLIVSFIILFLGIQLGRTSFDKIIHPQQINFSIIVIIILVISILIKLWQCLFYAKIGKIIHSITLTATSIDSRNDIIATSAVLLATIITRLTGFNLDGYMGIVVAVFILISGVKLVKDTTSPLLGMAPNQELVDEIYKKILSYEHILGLHDLTVHSYGENECFASVHCEVDARQDIMISHDIIDNIERDFLRDFGIHLVVHLDPIITDDERTNKLKEDVKQIIKQILPEITIHDFRVVWGVSHTNLIFDIVVPVGFKQADCDLVKQIEHEVKKINEAFNIVITVDHNYISCK